MTKMATTPLYGKNTSKIFSRTSGPHPIIVYSNDDPKLTLTYFMARSNLVIKAFLKEKGKTMDFAETVAASDVKIG